MAKGTAKATMTIDRHELCTVTGLTALKLNRIAATGAYKSHGHGIFMLGEAVSGVIKKLLEELETLRKGGRASSAARLNEVRAQEVEMRMAVERGELMARDEVLARYNLHVGTFRAVLNGIPAQFTRDLEQRKRLEELLNGALQTMHDKLTQFADEAETAEEEEVE